MNAVVPAVPDLTTKVTISTSPAVVKSVTVDAEPIFAEVLRLPLRCKESESNAITSVPTLLLWYYLDLVMQYHR